MKLIKRVIALVLILAIGAAVYVVYGGFELYREAVEEISIKDKIAEVQSQEHYTYYSQLPDTYVEAVIAAEDKRFRSHGGIDIIGTGRAILSNLKGGELREGGSTITQQLARNLYFEQDAKLTRKVAEMFTARALEKECGKDEILELYANVIYFGSGYYNIYDASHGYFGKDPKDLNDYEATMLAGIPNAPSVYDPTVNPDLAEQRRQQVISCMVQEGYVEEGEIE